MVELKYKYALDSSGKELKSKLNSLEQNINERSEMKSKYPSGMEEIRVCILSLGKMDGVYMLKTLGYNGSTAGAYEFYVILDGMPIFSSICNDEIETAFKTMRSRFNKYVQGYMRSVYAHGNEMDECEKEYVEDLIYIKDTIKG